LGAASMVSISRTGLTEIAPQRTAIEMTAQQVFAVSSLDWFALARSWSFCCRARSAAVLVLPKATPGGREDRGGEPAG